MQVLKISPIVTSLALTKTQRHKHNDQFNFKLPLKCRNLLINVTLLIEKLMTDIPCLNIKT